MADTYHVRASFLDTEPLPNYEATAVLSPEGTYLKHCPFLTIFNDAGSGKIVKLRRIALRTIAGQGQTTLLPTNMQANFISAIATDGETITPSKMDASTANLPSQVKVQQYAVCTDTSGSELRRLLNMPQQNMTRALAMAVTPKFQTSDWSKSMYDGTATGWILNEGEGITIHNTAVPFSMAWRIYCIFTTSAGTYMVSEVMRSVDDIRDLFTIYNGSGSGKVVHIRQLNVMEAGTDEVPYVSMVRLENYRGGDAVSTMKMDSSTSLPASIKVLSRAETTLYGASWGGAVVHPRYRRVPLNTWGTSPGLAGVDMKSQLETMLIVDAVACSTAIQPVTLRAGEGIGLMQVENASGLGRWALSVTFTVEDEPATGGVTAAPRAHYGMGYD